MSGPKTVNIRIHDQGLNSLISIQSEIKTLVSFIESFAIHDSAQSFTFEGSVFLGSLRAEIQACLKSVELPAQKELSYNQSSALANAIMDKQKALNKLILLLKDLKIQCETVQKKYLLSVNTHTELQVCIDTRCNILKKMISSIEAYLDKQDADATRKEVLDKLQQIPIQLHLPKFSLDLYKSKAKLKDQVLDFFKEQENKVFSIHEQYCNALNITAIKKTVQKKSSSGIQQKLLSEIDELLNQLPESSVKNKICNELEYYCNTPEYCTDTTYKHLKNSILGYIASISRRQDLLFIQHQLTSLPQNESCVQLKKLLNEEITNDLISESNYVKLHTAWEALEADNHKQKMEQYAKEQESLYIKEKLVKALGEMNYTVVSDAKGLPESRNSFLFQVPNQKNYIYIEYLKGKYLYNFMVPEKVSELSREDLRRKVSEMDNACKGFLQAMKNLHAYGVNFDYIHKESSENHLITIPEAIQKNMNLDVQQEEQLYQNSKNQKRMSND